MRGFPHLLIAFLAAASGCAKDTTNANPPPALSAHELEESPPEWPFQPARLRIHPLTRLVMDADGELTLIEVRLELFDDTDDTVKGVGLVRIDLHAVDISSGRSDTISQTPQASWNRDLRDLELNAQHFDDVTRTYLFRLEIEPDDLPPAAELRAYFAATSGRLLQADLVLRME